MAERAAERPREGTAIRRYRDMWIEGERDAGRPRGGHLPHADIRA